MSQRPHDPAIVEMVAIPAGLIAMRDDRVDRTWEVQLSPYQIGRYPITQAQFAATLGLTVPVQSQRKPVVNVSWIDAVRFCNLLSRAEALEECYDIEDGDTDASLDPRKNGFRLATEAEWEHACRAGTSGPRYGNLESIAWYASNSKGQLHEVGQKQPNAWGLYDMLGNCWEWCDDQYDPVDYGSYRIFRGGGWADPERGCLATNRRRSHPTFAIDDLGFRVARGSA